MQQHSIKKNTIYNAIKTFSSIIFPLITFPYVSRVLLAENIGKVNFGLSIISYFSLIATLGITTHAIRECSAVRNNKEKLGQVASQIFSINVFTTVFAYVLLAFTLLFFRKLDNYRTLIVIQSLSILLTTLGADWLNSAMEDFQYITLRTVSFQLLSLILMFVLVREPEDYLKYAVVSLVSSSGANIVNIWYRKRFCKVRFTLRIDWRTHLSPIVFLFVMLLAQQIFSHVDSTMLGLMCGDREVGIYATAQKVNHIVSQVVSSVLWVIMPRMSYLFAEKNYTEINRLLRKLLGFNILLGLPCAVGLMALAEDVILILAGPSFIDAAIVLKIRTLSFVFALFGGNLLGNAILLPSKQEKYYMFACVITAVINVITNYLFIPSYGAVAAAGTTALCSFLMLIILAFRVDKNIQFKRVTNLIIPPVVGCVGIVVMCTAFSNVDPLFLRVILSIGSSVALYALTQIVLKNEVALEVVSFILSRLRRTSDNQTEKER